MPLTTFELKVYGRAGVSRRDAEQWHAAGVDHNMVETVRTFGTELKQARRWSAAGMPIGFAVAALRDGHDPLIAWREVPVGDEGAAQPTRNRAAEDQFEALSEDLLLSLSDIADLARRDLPAVSRWSKQEDFPRPLVAGRSPLFAADAAERFVARRLGPRYERSTQLGWAWSRAVRSLSADDAPFELVAVMITLAVHLQERGERLSSLMEPEGDDATSRSLRLALAELRDVEGVGDLVGEAAELGVRLASVPLAVIRRLDAGLDAGLNPARLLDDSLEVLGGAVRSRHGSITSHALIELMVALSGASDADRRAEDERVSDRRAGGRILDVLDPCAGTGELLLWMANRLRCTAGSDSVRLLVAGSDVDGAAARVTRARFFLRGVPTEIRVGDALKGEAQHQARFVVSDLPAVTSKRMLERWLALVNGAVVEGGRVVVAGNSLMLPAAPNDFVSSPIEPWFGRLETLVLLPMPTKARSRTFPVIAVFGTDQTDTAAVIDVRQERIAGPSRMRSTLTNSSRIAPIPPQSESERPEWLNTTQILASIQGLTSGDGKPSHRAKVVTLGELAALLDDQDVTGSADDRELRLRAGALLDALGSRPERDQLKRAMRDLGIPVD